jgi:hypothetical protein
MGELARDFHHIFGDPGTGASTEDARFWKESMLSHPQTHQPSTHFRGVDLPDPLLSTWN